jgi:hypothetical protein
MFKNSRKRVAFFFSKTREHKTFQVLIWSDVSDAATWHVNASAMLLLPGKVKVELFLSFVETEHHAMKAYWVSGGIAPRILWLRH